MEIKTNSSYLILAAFFCILSQTACQKDNATADYQRPVVEGYLIPGNPIAIKVYYQKYLEDTLTHGYPITGLQLRVSDGAKTVLLEEDKPGVYGYADSNFVLANKTYSLNFLHLGKTISAQTVIPKKPIGFKASATEQEVPTFSIGTTPTAFVPVAFSWENAEQAYHLLSFQNIENYPSSISRNTALKTEVQVEQGTSYNTDRMNFNYLGKHKVWLFRINKEYSDAIKTNTGNSLNLTNPSTNVVNGLGIFTGLNGVVLELNVYQ